MDGESVGSLWESQFKDWVFLHSLGASNGIPIIWDTMFVAQLDNLLISYTVLCS